MANSRRKQHCNKTPFPTKEAADITLAKWKKKRRQGDNPLVTHMHSYKCEFCPKWHIGRSAFRGIDWKAVDGYEKQLRERIEQARKEHATRETVPDATRREHGQRMEASVQSG